MKHLLRLSVVIFFYCGVTSSVIGMHESESFCSDNGLSIKTQQEILPIPQQSAPYAFSFPTSEPETPEVTRLMQAILDNNFFTFTHLIKELEKINKHEAVKIVNKQSPETGFTALMYVCAPHTKLTMQDRFSYLDLLLKAGAMVDTVSFDGRCNARSLLGLLAQAVQANEVKAVQLLSDTVRDAELKQTQRARRPCGTPVSERSSFSPTSVRTPRTGEGRFGADFKYE